MCPCSKGLECPVCGHYPNKAVSLSKVSLADIIKPGLLRKERAAYKRLEKAKAKKAAGRKTAKKSLKLAKPKKATKPGKASKPRKSAKSKKK
jgi:hypothetical protein